MEQKSEIRILGLKVWERRGIITEMIRNNWLSQIFGSTTATGQMVNDETAMTVSSVWACVQLLSNTFAIPALNVYKKKGDIRELQADHPIQLLIHRKPNDIMSAFEWRQTMMMLAAITGNSYSIIRRSDRTGSPVSFDFIPNSRTSVKPFIYQNKLWYQVEGEKLPIPARDMIHYKWNSTDGISGRSPVSIARENIGQSLAIQDYGSKVFSEGAAKRIALKTPAKLTPDQKESFQNIWNKKYSGTDNMHKVMFIEGKDTELVEIGMSPEDAQFLGVMKFKIEEIARIYGVPLHLIQSLDHATNNNIEHQAIQFVIYTMMTHYVKFEQELDLKLFPDKPEYYTKHNTNALVRGDMKTEAEYFGKMSDLGVYSINEIRKIKDENPIDDGDGHLVQVNRVPVEQMNDLTGSTLSKLADAAVKRAMGNGKKVESVNLQ